MDDLIVLIVRMIARMLRDRQGSQTALPTRARSGNIAPSRVPAARPSAMRALLRRPGIKPRGGRAPVLAPNAAKSVQAAPLPIVRVATAHRDVRSINAYVGALTAASLRRQIVINEILMPPLALRKEQ